MNLVVFGFNHQTADVSLRERVAFAPERLAQALVDIQQGLSLSEVAILSTCNRTEIYLCQAAFQLELLLEWLAEYHGISQGELTGHYYVYQQAQAVGHLMKVASGLDSLVLGEPQILGQLKATYGDAQQAQTLGTHLHRVFQQVFATAKSVRSNTAIGRHPVSVAYASVNLAQQIFANIEQCRVLVIGAGETAQLVAKYLKEKGVKKLLVANRTLERAELLAKKVNGEALLIGAIGSIMPDIDIVITSTASQLPIVGKGMIESALKKRRHSPMLLVDIAVPRDVEPEVAKLDDAYLYTVDDLARVVSDNQRSRENEALQAEAIIEGELSQFLAKERARQSAVGMSAYRQQADRWRQQAVDRVLKEIANGKDPEAAINQMTRSLTNKLLHVPAHNLQRIGETNADLQQLTQTLFKIEGQDNSHD